MIEFEKPNIECVEADDKRNYAKFICEPLERGYGMTIGNSLRRILLSSLPGAAITSVRINGVVHEFSTVKGVVEDVPELIVNLKNVRLKVFDNEEKTIGLIAQEAAEFDLDGFNMVDNLEATGQNGDFMQMKESKLVYVLWKAVQELSVEVEELKTQIASLK